jgi:inorganic pyrophosphatase
VKASAPRLDQLPALTTDGDVLAVIEATQHTRSKFKFDAELATFVLERVLPSGLSYPYDFGFVPSTLADDGDPLDILILNDEPIPVGCVARCKLVGALVAEQSTRGRRVRNDRLVGVPTESRRYGSARVIKDISADVLGDVERFFIQYNQTRGVRFEPKRRYGAVKALALLRAAVVAFKAKTS